MRGAAGEQEPTVLDGADSGVSPASSGRYDLVVDSGCFHHLPNLYRRADQLSTEAPTTRPPPRRSGPWKTWPQLCAGGAPTGAGRRALLRTAEHV